MNIEFRLNKWLYILLFVPAANRALNVFVTMRQIYFVKARVLKITIVTICVLHWMSCL